MGKGIVELHCKPLEVFHWLRNGGALQTEGGSECALGAMSSPEIGIMMLISSQ